MNRDIETSWLNLKAERDELRLKVLLNRRVHEAKSHVFEDELHETEENFSHNQAVAIPSYTDI